MMPCTPFRKLPLPPRRRSILLGAIAAVIALPVVTSSAADYQWNAATSSWFTPGNWTPAGPPGVNDDAMINNGGTAQVDAAGATTQELRVGLSATGHLTISAGATLSSTTSFIGQNAGSTGSIVISGAGALWTNDHNISVGSDGAGTLTIQSGGKVQNNTVLGGGFIGAGVGSTGTVTVDGAGSEFNSLNLQIGSDGTAFLTVQNGGSSDTFNTTLGQTSTGKGTLTVTGASSIYTTTGFRIGYGGTGTVNILAGGTLTSSDAELGSQAGSSGTVTIDGVNSTWASKDLNVGYLGDSTLNVTNGGVVTSTGVAEIAIVGGVTGVATVNGTNSQWTITKQLYISYLGNGTLNVQAGGAVSNTDGWIGEAAGSVGKATVTGTSSTWTNSGNLTVGNAGGGSLNVQSAGVVSDVNGILGNKAGSTGTATVTGTNSTWTNTGTLTVGLLGNSTLDITLGGKVTNTSGLIASGAGVTGKVTVSGTASTWTNSTDLTVGNSGLGTLIVSGAGLVSNVNATLGKNTGSTGTATVTGTNSTWTNTGTFGLGVQGTATLDVLAAGAVTATGKTIFGDTATGIGTATVNGTNSSFKITGDLLVGNSGQGTLNIQAAGLVTSANASLGDSTGGVGAATVTGTSSLWTVTGNQLVGNAGQGTMNVLAAGKVTTSGLATIGAASAGKGVVLVDGTGSSWAVTSNLLVGDSGNGQLTIQNGGLVSSSTGVIGNTLGGVGVATISGPTSKWTTTGTLAIGNFGDGTLRILQGAVVSNASGELGRNVGSSGTVIVSDAGSTWSPGALAIGGTAVGPAGQGLVRIINGGTVNATPITVWTPGTIEVDSQYKLNSSALKFDGGTLRTIDSTTFVNDATLSAGGVIFDTEANESTLTGIFSDAGGLTKVGTGTLFVPTTQTYTGETRIQAGALIVTGSLASAQTTVETNGLLGGTGLIGGNVLNKGIVSPGLSPGTLTIKGSYTQFQDGVLRIEVAGRNPGQFDQLAVGGRATLEGGLEIVQVGKPKLRVGDRLEILTAGDGVSGTFSDVKNPFESNTMLSLEVVYEPKAVVLELVQGSFLDLEGLTENQRSVAKALDHAALDPRARKLIGFLNQERIADLPGDFDRLAPEELTSVFTISTALAAVQSANTQRRLADVRSGATGFSAAGLAMQGTGPGYSGTLFGAAGPTGQESKETKEVMPPAPEEKRWGTFLTGVGEWVDVEGSENARGYDVTTGGFTLGLDYKVTPNFVLGLAAGYAGTAADLTDDGRVWVNGGKLGLYSTFFTGGFYLDTAVNAGYNSFDTKRTALGGTARGSTEGGELNVLGGVGYDWKVGALSIGPTATFEYSLVGIDDYAEHGSLAPLEIARRNAESIRSAVGFKATYDWKLGGIVIRPEIRGAWQHEYGDSSYALDATFADGASGKFLVNGPEIGRDSLLIGGGFAVQLSERTTTYLYYDGELARRDYERHSVSGGIRVSF